MDSNSDSDESFCVSKNNSKQKPKNKKRNAKSIKKLIQYPVYKLRQLIKSDECLTRIDAENHMISILRHKTDSKDTEDTESVIIGNIIGYKCNYNECEYITNKKMNITDHIISHSMTNPFVCDLCEKGFTLGIYLKKHQMLVHTDQKPFQCEWPGCDSTFKTTNNLKCHMRSHTGKRVQKTMTKLREVMKNGDYVSNTDTQNEMIFVIRETHIDNDSNERKVGKIVGFKCNYSNDCSYICTDKRDIKDHLLSHSTAKPFVCDICNKGYRLRYSMESHKRYSHNKESRPVFKCQFPDCQYKSVRNYDMTQHYISHKTNKDFKCKEIGCNKVYKTIYQLKTHIKKHSNHRPFGCDWPGCEWKFRTKDETKQHLLTHMGERKNTTNLKKDVKSGNYISSVDPLNPMLSVIRKPVADKCVNNANKTAVIIGYKCNYDDCGYLSVARNFITDHLNTHTKERPYECEICHKTYPAKKYMRTHMELMHKNVAKAHNELQFPDYSFETN